MTIEERVDKLEKKFDELEKNLNDSLVEIKSDLVEIKSSSLWAHKSLRIMLPIKLSAAPGSSIQSVLLGLRR